MRKLIVDFPMKYESRGIKIARVNSIRITKFINLLLFCYGVAVRDNGRLSVNIPFIEKSMIKVIFYF